MNGVLCQTKGLNKQISEFWVLSKSSFIMKSLIIDMLEIYLAVFKVHNNQQSPTLIDNSLPGQFFSTYN